MLRSREVKCRLPGVGPDAAGAGGAPAGPRFPAARPLCPRSAAAAAGGAGAGSGCRLRSAEGAGGAEPGGSWCARGARGRAGPGRAGRGREGSGRRGCHVCGAEQRRRPAPTCAVFAGADI